MSFFALKCKTEQVRALNIKKVDDKPMVIHTKEKAKLHIKGAPEAKIKGRNVLVIDKRQKIAESMKEGETCAGKGQRSVAWKVKMPGKSIRLKAGQGKESSYSRQDKACEEIQNSIQKENAAYAERKKSDSYRKVKRDKEKAAGKKHDGIGSLTSVGTKVTLEQMEGGNEVYSSYITAKSLSLPVTSAADAGRRLYRSQAAKKIKIKKVQSEKKIGKRIVKDSEKKAVKAISKEMAKKSAKETTKAAVFAAGTASTGAGGVFLGEAAGEAAGRELDKRDKRNAARNRMMQLFLSKFRQEENQDSIGKALKDLVMMRFSIVMKYAIKYVGLFLMGLFALVALVALPLIAVLAIIYNSPLAIFFPSISSAETTQEVLSGYVAEFNKDVNEEISQFEGYDKSEKIYVNFTGEGIPDNYCDILAVYMVKHGNGDTATDMTDKAKKNLKKVFDDMCSYRISSGAEVGTDEEGNTITCSVKYVNITLKTYQDMILAYRFNKEEQDMLAELMKPENLAMLGYSGPGSGSQDISPEQYQAVVDAISDVNGKKVVEFALSKVGYPYSQELRDSGTHFDCSSLAYYAWKYAGVDISYQGSTTAAAEGQLCYENNWLVYYDEMQPGDLIFYSYSRNGRFFNINHVAIYAGNGMVVEAANERLGVVYRPVPGKGSIVLIGRPR